MRLFALAENFWSSTKVLIREVNPPNFCLPISILSAWRSRKPGSGASSESPGYGAGVAAGEAVAGEDADDKPESVRICENLDCSLSTVEPLPEAEDGSLLPPMPKAGTETPALESRLVAPWFKYPLDGDGGSAE